MANVLISYDLRRVRQYQPLYDLLARWGARRLHQSLWIADLVPGDVSSVRNELMACIDQDDQLLVLSLAENFDWASWGRTSIRDDLAPFTTSLTLEG
jgi:CRISPR/Cas system-associated endoribonuclease Cas2